MKKLLIKMNMKINLLQKKRNQHKRNKKHKKNKLNNKQNKELNQLYELTKIINPLIQLPIL